MSLYASRCVGISALRGKHVGGRFASRSRTRHGRRLISVLSRDLGWGVFVPCGLGYSGAICPPPGVGTITTSCRFERTSRRRSWSLLRPLVRGPRHRHRDVVVPPFGVGGRVRTGEGNRSRQFPAQQKNAQLIVGCLLTRVKR